MEIKALLDKIDSPIFSVPGIGPNLGAVILAEIGDFNRFSSPDKILAFAGCSPSTYQSGQLYSSHAKMEKRGSRYLRYALLNAAKRSLHLGTDFHCLPQQENVRRQALQCCCFSCRKKACAATLPFGNYRGFIPSGFLIFLPDSIARAATLPQIDPF